MNRRGNAVLQARALARWRIVQRVSSEGGTKQQAADQAQLSPGGLDSLLYRLTRSTRWPLGAGDNTL